jgi:hypothetical protein
VKPTPFNPTSDLPPTPFERRHCLLAEALKDAGLDWKPHVGCFVWDRDACIEVPSPFPNRIYFILNLGHFLKIFGSAENIRDQLVWLPTWHQARLVAEAAELQGDAARGIGTKGNALTAGEDLLALYELILQQLRCPARTDGNPDGCRRKEAHHERSRR